MSTEITDYDTSEYLENEQDIIAYLNAIAEYDDPALMQAALGNVAKARGMTQIAKDAGVGRESLYKSLNREGNPSFRTIVKVVNALGGRIVVESMSTGANGIRIKGSKVGLYKANGKALKTTGRDE